MKKFLFLLILWPVFASSEIVDRIVAVVGEEIITQSDLKSYRGSAKKDPLEGLIREKLLQMEIERLEIEVTQEDTANAVREVLGRNRMTLEQLKAELEQKGTAFEQYKRELAREVRKMKFLGQVIFPRIKVSEEEITKRLGPFPKEEERIRVRHQLIESRLQVELENYLDEVREKTYVEIKK